MAHSDLKRLIPDAPPALCAMLDPARGPLQPPIRSEIFGLQRFAQHGRSLGATHRAGKAASRTATFMPRLQGNVRALREAHRYIALQESSGYDISPAAEWLLDNFHLIEAQLKEVHEGLPRSYFRALPVLLEEPLAGLPRVYGVAWAFVAHTDGAFDEDLAVQFLSAYQETCALGLREIWALPTTLRVVLIENLRRLAERVATSKAAREAANLCSDHIETIDPVQMDSLLALLRRRGVGPAFLLQMAQRQRGHKVPGDAWVHEWLQEVMPDPGSVHRQQSADQTADNLSVSNAVTSLRAIGDADWPDIVARSSTVMRLMLTAAAFEAEHAGTRDQTLHEIERLARRSRRSELAVAQALIELMHGDSGASTAGHWLIGAGRGALLYSLGLPVAGGFSWRGLARRAALPVYLGSLLVGSSGLVGWLLLHPGTGVAATGAGTAVAILTACLMMFPASEAVVAVINRLISESARPRHLPRLALVQGVPPEHRVIVVIPALLSNAAAIQESVHRLHLHHLANPERHAQFALLTDWADAETECAESDDALLAEAMRQVRVLNERYPVEARSDDDAGPTARFILLHRSRRFSETEQRWIGWERKRGKLETLVRALAEGSSAGFVDLGDLSRIGAGIRYVVTLDSDTELPPGRLRELVGVAAHPQNRPRLAADGRSVVGGYGILQPRVVTPLPAPRDFTPYHWLFAGQCGIDPYSVATSEVYQDVFGEGTFNGKGLINVDAMHAVLSGRLPDGQVLSHDLLEGSIARCAAVTDITLIEDAPFHADVAASRIHRWTRGDWQLLPFLLRPRYYRLRAIHCWKMFDNLRRSLVAPMSLGLLLLALSGRAVSPWVALSLVMAALMAGPLMGAMAALLTRRDDLARTHFYYRAGADLGRASLSGLWLLGQLLQHAMMATDAVVRALYRQAVSRRHLLQWTTAAAAQAQAKIGLAAVLRQHWGAPVVALLLLGSLIAAGTPHLVLAVTLCLLWAVSPVSTWWVSRPRPARAGAALAAEEHAFLAGVARDTWRLFERCLGPADNHLPPDNLQTVPHEMLAHRTSPTNIGLYLLSVACARAFGWIGTQDLLARMEATLATLAGLARHRGHYLNWYDTQTLAPLLPMYVSTVDSGNLSGHLLAVAQACRELASAPHDADTAARGILASRQRLVPLLARGAGRAADLPPGLVRLLALADPMAERQRDGAAFDRLLRQGTDELATLEQPPEGQRAEGQPAEVDAGDELTWCLGDYVATLRSAKLDVASDPQAAGERLQALASDCERLAGQANFGFLYHRRRHLFHIGYRVAEQQLDAGFYDLLASESRLTSLVAIAKGDVPVSHWASLGRPFYAAGTMAGLRSWSGSMFEYLMPTLVLSEPHGSALREACQTALREQIAFAKALHVPWGISESAYAGRDHTLAYQYAPQGVPRLALRRTPLEELVVAPYATALAAQISPHDACLNFAALQAQAPRTRYGFIEALDFSPARRPEPGTCTPVAAFMTHHQGMTIVALANVLLGGPAQRWGMANPPVEAVASLLHERSPREVSKLHAPPLGPPPQSQQQLAPGLLREVFPGEAALEPTHLLGNGRYTVSLRANGAGWSRWGQTDITRSRDDALRDAHGAFFYLRWDQQPQPVSITQHPAPDPAAHYKSTYHADRVCFDAAWPGLEAHSTVWVSPEDDIEFRQVELRNLGDRIMDIEVISAFEVTLTDARADEAHPAFANLFVRARWQPSQQALVFERRPRLASETVLQAAHFLADTDPQLVSVRCETDRRRWLGRNRDWGQPLASFDARPIAPAGEPSGADLHLDTGLDPICAMAVRCRIAPRGKVQLTFATAASDSASVLRAVIDKYRQPSHVERASLMSATLSGIRQRAMRMSPENFAAIQTLTTALVLSLTRPDPAAGRVLGNADHLAPGASDRRLLWRFGISGERPLILVLAGVLESLGLVRALAQGLRLWAWGGIACDLVVVNTEVASYQMTLQHEITTLRERHGFDSPPDASPTGAGNRAPTTAFHLLHADDLSADELATLQAQARVRLHADGRPLVHHVQEWLGLHEQAMETRHDTSTSALSVVRVTAEEVPAPSGAFVGATGEFAFEVGARLRPRRPWINVLANPGFGAQLSEAGGGYTWALNSRLNQLTAWSNDPVVDPPAEWFLLQDCSTLEVWSVAPSAWAEQQATYRVAHGQGFSTISHRRTNLEVTASWCVDVRTSVKQVRLTLVNCGLATLRLRAVGIVEWMMGANRADRATVMTSIHRQRLPDVHDAGVRPGAAPSLEVCALLATQRERSAGFGDGTAFLALAGEPGETDDWTCDRRECFDARGQPVLPDHFGAREGTGLDPCAALSSPVVLAAGETAERVFLLGYAENPGAARHLAMLAAAIPARQRLDEVRRQWDRLLGATIVRTPDPLFDLMVNRWLLYQAVSCRLWAKAGFYQAGGATGFRDQLQDAMALAWTEPRLLREQIVLCASRQFVEGDVQHWWHAPTGAGVRTRFSDDLLWLPHACVHYLRSTGDGALLEERVRFIEGAAVADGAEDSYAIPEVSGDEASVYEHCARAIDRSLRVGTHGLPLIGSGDWNDGMNRVGIEGRGESVWLGWFLCQLAADFVPLARARGDATRALCWEQAASAWRAALLGPAWDGNWFKRAFFDDGQPLGSHRNAEARIDLIAQAWAVLSDAAPRSMQGTALEAVERHLVDAEAGLIRLLDPPFVQASPSPGYIQAYPPGVRENGSQYSHAAVWALMARARFESTPTGGRRGTAESDEGADAAYRYFTYLSPAHRAVHPARGAAYEVEPYVMAGDVYSQPPHVGRGGWSWYTGSAAWMHRAAIESIFGLEQGARQLRFTPCLPSHWHRAELLLTRDDRTIRFILVRSSASAALEEAARSLTEASPTVVLLPGEPLNWPDLARHSCFVIPLEPVAQAAATPAADPQVLAPGAAG